MIYARFLASEWAALKPSVRHTVHFFVLALLFGLAGGIESGVILP